MTAALALFHVCATIGIGLGFIRALRWVSGRSRAAALIVGVGVALRLFLAAGLFWASYLGVESLRSLHTGDGFWRVAPDALGYFIRAGGVAEHGGWPLDAGRASPGYVHLLSFWMLLTGPTVPGGVLLNVAAYLGTCLLIVLALDPRRGAAHARACTISVAAFTFSPASAIFGSQTLKDVPFAFFVIVSCLAIQVLLRDEPPFTLTTTRTVACILTLGAMAFVLAGMRAYYPFLQVFAMVLALAAWMWRMGRTAWVGRLGTALGLVAVTWVSFAAGAGDDYYTYERLVIGSRPVDVKGGEAYRSAGTSAAEALETYREGFVTTGGATNIVWTGWDGTACDATCGPAERAVQKAATVLVGLLVMFVPISLLRLAGLVAFDGGRGLLLVTDLDTVYLIGSTLLVAVVLWRDWWPQRRNLPYAVFTVSFAVLLAVLMSYVVTNFGTLFRLRLMVATLVWVMPFAVAAPAILGRSGPADRTELASRRGADAHADSSLARGGAAP